MPKVLRSKQHKVLLAVLATTRRHAGVTQRQLADRLKKPRSYVSKIETGERQLHVLEFIEWSRALDVDPEALFRRLVQW